MATWPGRESLGLLPPVLGPVLSDTEVRVYYLRTLSIIWRPEATSCAGARLQQTAGTRYMAGGLRSLL